MFEIKRCSANPILKADDDVLWMQRGVRNPGVIWDGEKFRMIFTGNGSNDRTLPMRLGYAESADGINFTMNSEPFVNPSEDENFFDHNGMDDARITEMEGAYYFTYASPSPTVKNSVPFDPKGNRKPDWLTYFRRGGIARTTDWQSVEKLGPVTNLIMADANHVLFPEKLFQKEGHFQKSQNCFPVSTHHQVRYLLLSNYQKYLFLMNNKYLNRF